MKKAIRMFLVVALAASFTPVFADDDADSSADGSQAPAAASTMSSDDATSQMGAASSEPRDDLYPTAPGWDGWVKSIWEPQP